MEPECRLPWFCVFPGLEGLMGPPPPRLPAEWPWDPIHLHPEQPAFSHPRGLYCPLPQCPWSNPGLDYTAWISVCPTPMVSPLFLGKSAPQ